MKIKVIYVEDKQFVPVAVLGEMDDHYDVMEPSAQVEDLLEPAPVVDDDGFVTGDELADMFPRGAGDPDFYGYPGEAE